MNNHYIQNSGDKYIPKELETAFQLNSGDKHISKELYTVQNDPYSLLYASIKTLILECFMIAYTNSRYKYVTGMLYDSIYLLYVI